MNRVDARPYMEQAISVMRRSVLERRADGKVGPLVGAVLVFPDGSTIEASRGELREGDHAEFTLLERKCRDIRLDEVVLFATLEPCAPGARSERKLGCAERVIFARIREVWVGIEDPDPKVDRQGIRHLEANGVKVEIFDSDLQEKIRKENREFLLQALDRAEEARSADFRTASAPAVLLDVPVQGAGESDLKPAALARLAGALGIGSGDSGALREQLVRQGLAIKDDQSIRPTGSGLVLFGTRPRDFLPQAGLIASVRYPDGQEEVASFEQPLVEIPAEVEAWLRTRLPGFTSREAMERRDETTLPFEPVREAIVNALVHRDYEIQGAKCQLVVTPDTIVVKSPGRPVPPITLEQLASFSAPALSRNPKIHYVFRQLGLAEEAGLGMATMRDIAARHALPSPRYTFEDPYLAVTIYRTADAGARHIAGIDPGSLSPDERRSWEFVLRAGSTTVSTYAAATETAPRTAQRHLARLVELGLARRVGKGPATHYEVVRG